MTITLELVLILLGLAGTIVGFLTQASKSGAEKQWVKSEIDGIKKDITAIKEMHLSDRADIRRELDEHKSANKEQHIEFYATRDRVTSLDAKIDHIMATMEEIKRLIDRRTTPRPDVPRGEL